MSNRTPSTESPTMADQVKDESSVKNKLTPTLYLINNYPPPSSVPLFSAPNSNTFPESATPLASESAEIGITDETEVYLNHNGYFDSEIKEQEEDDKYFSSFPPGYRFRPHDEELIMDYLIKKIFNQQLPRNRIKDVELYKYNPDTLAAKYKAIGDDGWYFFTPRDRKYPNGDRPNRAAGDGYWKATGADKPIYFKKRKVGLKKSLVFYRGKAPRGKKTDWIMHEYKVINAPKRIKISQQDMKLDDWVLCKIRKKPGKPQKADKIAKSANEQPENVTSGGSNCGNSGFVCSYPTGISNPSEMAFEQDRDSAAYNQQMMAYGCQNNFVQWMEYEETAIGHLIYEPPLQQLDNIDFQPSELEQIYLSIEKDANGTKKTTQDN